MLDELPLSILSPQSATPSSEADRGQELVMPPFQSSAGVLGTSGLSNNRNRKQGKLFAKRNKLVSELEDAWSKIEDLDG